MIGVVTGTTAIVYSAGALNSTQRSSAGSRRPSTQLTSVPVAAPAPADGLLTSATSMLLPPSALPTRLPQIGAGSPLPLSGKPIPAPTHTIGAP